MPSYACIPVEKARETSEKAIAIIEAEREAWREWLARRYADDWAYIRVEFTARFPFVRLRRPTLDEAREDLKSGACVRDPWHLGVDHYKTWKDAQAIHWAAYRHARGILEMCQGSQRVIVNDEEWLDVVRACEAR